MSLFSFLPPVTVGPVKRGLWIIGIVILIILIIEIVALIILRSQIGRYKTFWQNKAQEQGEITYVALGDSAAQGIGATSPMRGYVGLIAKHLEEQTGKNVNVINLSVSGAQLKDGIDVQLPKLKKLKPDIVTVEIGANDIKDFESEKFRKDFKTFIDQLPDGTYIADMPDFGGGPLLSNARSAAKIARDEISKQPRLRFVALEEHTMENFNHLFNYAPDFFHPNNAGYKIWAEAFIKAINESDTI